MRTPRDCARLLADLHQASFGGEESGAYKIGREDLKSVTGRPMIHQTIIEDIADWLVEEGLILIDRDAYFLVARPCLFDAVRTVPAEALERHQVPIRFGAPPEDRVQV